MFRCFLLSIAAALVVSAAGRGQVAPPFVTPFPDLRGEYLGQTPPGLTAQRFAPGIISTEALDSPPVFTPDGHEVFWSRIGPSPGVFHSRVDGGRWTAPEKAAFCREGGLDVTPLLFDSGRQMLFLSTRALPDGRQPTRGFFTFWLTRREGAGWSTPAPIDSFFTGVDDFGAIAEDGTLYLRQASATTGIQRVARRDGRYLAPEPLSPPVNGFPALVGPGERYLIISSALPDAYGERDLYLLFHQPGGTWSQPLNLGPAVNGPKIEHHASLSADGRYLFFSSNRTGNFDVYWIDARVIDARPGRD